MSEPTDAPRQKPPVRGRPFEKGNRANPKGRPPGTRHHVTLLAERLMSTDLPDVVRTVIDAARGGDMTAAKLILERVVPIRRGAPVRLELPTVNSARDVVAAAAVITAEVASGALTPEEGAATAALVDFSRRAIESADLEARLQALETRMDRDGTP